MSIKYFFIIMALLLIPTNLLALEAPPLTGRINDLAKLLSPEFHAKLEKKLASFELETSNQVVVLTIPTLQDDNIDSFSIRVAEAWKIGQKGKDNGILLILLKQKERFVLKLD